MMTMLWDDWVGPQITHIRVDRHRFGLGDDSAQMVVSFLSLACCVVKGAALLDKFEGQFLSNAIIFLYDCKRGDFLLVIAL
jgi:hypothetical protein